MWLRTADSLLNILVARGACRTQNSCKGDLKHFFMSGAIHELVDLCSNPFVGQDVYDILKRSIYFLLDNQFVVDPFAGQIMKVVVGTGMGLSHSSVIAGWAFMQGAELSLVNNMSSFEILAYHRLKTPYLLYIRTGKESGRFLGV